MNFVKYRVLERIIFLVFLLTEVSEELVISIVFQDILVEINMSLVMRKPAFCICDNKDADQLRGNRKADQRLCFRYIASTIP